MTDMIETSYKRARNAFHDDHFQMGDERGESMSLALNSGEGTVNIKESESI